MRERRRVRVTEAFFDQLDALLGEERGPNGEPTATDFIAMEVPNIVERFATGFDDMLELAEELPGGRVLITPGYLVRAMAVYGLLMTDGSIDVIGITIDA